MEHVIHFLTIQLLRTQLPRSKGQKDYCDVNEMDLTDIDELAKLKEMTIFNHVATRYEHSGHPRCWRRPTSTQNSSLFPDDWTLNNYCLIQK